MKTPPFDIRIRRLSVALLALLPWLALPPPARGGEATAEPSALVQTEPLKAGALPLTLTGFGVVAPEAGQSQNVSVQRAGRVERLRVAVGAQVQRGQPLMELAVDPAAAQAFAQARNAQQYTEGEVARIEALVAQGVLTAAQGTDLTQSLHFFMGLRLKAGLADLAAHRAVTGEVAVARLNSLDRDLLKDTLAVVKRFRTQLQQRYRLDAL